MPDIVSILAGLHRPFRRRTQPGERPGTVVSRPDAAPPTIHVIGYGPNQIFEKDVESADQVAELVGKLPVTWVNVDGLGDAETIKSIGRIFDLHPLALEDVVHVHQRAKVETYDEVLFIVARMASMEDHLETEQISIFLGQNFVITFQEELPGDCLGPVRDRLRGGYSRIRRAGPDLLMYSLLDATIDGYFPVLEEFGNRLAALDEEVAENPSPEVVARVHQLRNELLLLRKSAWPHRDAVNELVREPHPFITDETRLYLRDCYDHTVQIIDVVETYRELCSDLRDYYLAAISQRTNEIMKVLTIIATIFIPLSFIASVYGMNFDTRRSTWNMPELEWVYGYPFALGLMAAVASGLVYFFWRRGWLGE
jgi:magnesium transporter